MMAMTTSNSISVKPRRIGRRTDALIGVLLKKRVGLKTTTKTRSGNHGLALALGGHHALGSAGFLGCRSLRVDGGFAGDDVGRRTCFVIGTTDGGKHEEQGRSHGQ